MRVALLSLSLLSGCGLVLDLSDPDPDGGTAMDAASDAAVDGDVREDAGDVDAGDFDAGVRRCGDCLACERCDPAMDLCEPDPGADCPGGECVEGICCVGCIAPDGTCRVGDQPAYCGSQGADCVLCEDTQVCRAQQCVMPDPVEQLALGHAHTCALRSGELFCWGRNDEGQLGLGDTTRHTVPEAVIEPAGRTWAFVAAGGDRTCAINDDRKLYCWGTETSGELGDGGAANDLQAAPRVPIVGDWIDVALGPLHTCAIDDNDELFCWGTAMEGRLGIPTRINPSTTPVLVDGSRTWVDVDAGVAHTCARTASQTLWCWGANRQGQLGLNGTLTIAFEPLQVDPPTQTRALAVGGRHTCAIATNDELYCWGANGAGQVNLGCGVDQSCPERQSPIAVSMPVDDVAAGLEHTCLLNAGELFCWGRPAGARLGGPTMGGFDIAQVTGNQWTLVACGDLHTCGVRGGELLCWGTNGRGQAVPTGANIITGPTSVPLP